MGPANSSLKSYQNVDRELNQSVRQLLTLGVSKATIEAKLAEWNEAMEAIWDVNREVEAERVLEETRKLHMDKESK